MLPCLFGLFRFRPFFWTSPVLELLALPQPQLKRASHWYILIQFMVWYHIDHSGIEQLASANHSFLPPFYCSLLDGVGYVRAIRNQGRLWERDRWSYCACNSWNSRERDEPRCIFTLERNHCVHIFNNPRRLQNVASSPLSYLTDQQVGYPKNVLQGTILNLFDGKIRNNVLE